MAINPFRGMRLVFVGNSITAGGWFDANQSIQGGSNLLIQQLALPNSYLFVQDFQESSISISTAVAQPKRGFTVINSGVNGDTIADIEADIAGRITDYNPDVVVIEIGINDAAAEPDPTPIEDFRASYDNVLATVKATLPDVQIVCVGILCDGELWAASPNPHFAGNDFDTEIDLFNPQIQASALAHGAIYVDVRAAAALQEAVLNTPEPGAADGVLTLDGVHPNGTGQRLMSDTVKDVAFA